MKVLGRKNLNINDKFSIIQNYNRMEIKPTQFNRRMKLERKEGRQIKEEPANRNHSILSRKFAFSSCIDLTKEPRAK